MHLFAFGKNSGGLIGNYPTIDNRVKVETPISSYHYSPSFFSFGSKPWISCPDPVESNSDLIFHCSDHQGHVVFLGTVLAKGQYLVQDAFDDLRRCAVTARSQQSFEPLLSPCFAAMVFRFRDAVGVGDKHVTFFELKSAGGELGTLQEA